MRTLLRQAETAVVLYADPARRDETRRRLADGLLERCCAPPTPAATRSCSSPAPSPRRPRTDEHLAVVRGLLDGTDRLDGLSDRHRPALAPAAPAGRRRAWPTTPRSTRELDRDDTATGRRQAAAALAARPTRGGQGRGVGRRWSTTTSCRTRSRPRSSAASSQVGQLDLLRPYRRAVLRVADPGLGRADQRDRAEHRHRPVPDAARRAGDGRRRRRLARRRTRTRRRRCAGWSASPATAWRAPCAPRPATPRGRLTERVTRRATRGRRDTASRGVSVCSDCAVWACSARARTPEVMPPARSPAWNAEVIVIAASPAARSSSRRRTSGPVTISTRRAPGSTATSTESRGLVAERAVQLQRGRPAVALEGADVDRHRQLRLLPRQPDRPDHVVLLPGRERLTSGHLRHLPRWSRWRCAPRRRRRPGR